MAAQSYYNNGQPGLQDQDQELQQQQQQFSGDGANGYQQQQQPQYTSNPPDYQSKPMKAPGPVRPVAQDGKQTFDQTFKIERPKYNDIWAGVLLILTFLGFVAVSGLSLHGYATNHSGGIYSDTNKFSLNSNTVILFAFVLVVAFVLSWGYLLAARAFTKQFIWITGILNICLGLATALYYLYRHYWSAGIVFLVFAAFSIFCFITWIPRIPFSVLMLQTGIDVSRNVGHVFIIAALGGLVALIFSAWFSVTLVAVYVTYQPSSEACSNGSCSYAKVIGLVVFITFAGYWITEWIKNTIHTTIAGVYGSWYFCYGTPAGMPSGITRGAFRRATTTSFGSISFGSLIVALINMLRQAVSIAQQNEAGQGNAAAACAFCILGCIIGLLDWVVEYINRYSFSYISLYGEAYIPAARKTWTMMKQRGIDALVNDCLIGPVLTMGSTFVAFACALLSFLYLEATKPAYNEQGSFTAVILAFSFLIGLQVCQIFMTPLGSGVDTLFVAMAWDPEVLMSQHQELYAQMIRVYPRVQEAIHA